MLSAAAAAASEEAEEARADLAAEQAAAELGDMAEGAGAGAHEGYGDPAAEVHAAAQLELPEGWKM